MSSISATLTVKTGGTGIPVPPPTITPPPPTTPPPPPVTPPPTLPPVGPPVVEPPATASRVPLSRTTTTVTTQPGMKTLLLDTARWDLVTDAAGNIAVAAPPYAMAQDAASAVRLFRGELWYDTARGIPYFQQILGKQPPLGTMKNAFTVAATSVPNVESVQTFVSSITNRGVVGQMILTTTAGTKIAVTGALQATQLSDSGGNIMTDSSGNLMFTVL
jgi:hypothetical protein